jgi:glycerol-3-phosphate dehydrogenase
MRKLQTEVLVIGGGATGTGVLRDLAIRGFKSILVEKGDMTNGTTGRYHGLLHSGGRYVVKDPLAAKECIEENRVLRRIMPHCIEDTGGFFVLTPDDDPDYAPKFVNGCQTAGIPVEEISVRKMLQEEPLLNPNIMRCFRVPDASADSFLGADVNASSARQYGAETLRYHQVIELLTHEASAANNLSESQKKKVIGARCKDLIHDEEVEIYADMVVNASGAWAGSIAGTVGIQIEIIPGKGTMIAMNHRIVNTVINRCKMPSDGDILVPAHTVAVIGTTDVKVEDPDHYAIEPWEVRLLLEEGEKLVPGFKNMRMLRAWAGVRPLYQETKVADTRDVTRAYVLLDHEKRDGVEGLVTITSGKWTTYRKMAEVTVDLVCQKLGVERECRTHLEELPPAGSHAGYHHLGRRLADIEKNYSYGDLICECELATRDEVENAIIKGNAKTIDDVRRDVRLGMGPCQGGFCTYRVAGLLHQICEKPSNDNQPADKDTPSSGVSVENTNLALRDFLQERWKGLLPILWGQQLRQERLDELIYLSLLNADHLPGPASSRLSPISYDEAVNHENLGERNPLLEPLTQGAESETSTEPRSHNLPDVLVIGAGLAGLTAAWQASQRGKKVRVISKGWGALYWHTGCIDLLGYQPPEREKPVTSPIESLERLMKENPHHPYALAGLPRIEAGLEGFKSLCSQFNYPMSGSLERNWLLPTSLGTFRPTCLAPETMIAGDQRLPGKRLIVGFKQFPDFYPNLIADNLKIQGIQATGITLDLPSLRKSRFATGRVLAALFETSEFRVELVEALKNKIGSVQRIGFPAVLGLGNPLAVLHELQAELDRPLFEIPTLPPSIGGMRLHSILVSAIENAHGRVYDGMEALSADVQDKNVKLVWTEAAARRKPNHAQSFILATGGILGGGLRGEYEGLVREVVFDLPITNQASRDNWFQRQFLSPTGHAIYQAGVLVDSEFHPIDRAGQSIYNNLYAAGATLSFYDAIRERSVDGTALITGFTVGNMV